MALDHGRGPHRAAHQLATAVGAGAAEMAFGAAGAKGAFVGADARLRRGRQVPIAALTIRPELEHAANSTGFAARRTGAAPPSIFTH